MFKKKIWKVLSLVIVMLMVATACGGQQDSESMEITVALSSPHVWI